MSEAKEGCAFSGEVDEHTFVRFSQYAYTGDYTTADPEILLDASSIATTRSTPNEALPDPVKADIEEASAPVTSVNDGLGTFSISKKDKKKGKRRVLLKCADEEARDYDYQSLLSKDFDERITFPILQLRCFKFATSFMPEGHR
jgi:hypothetical protein